MGMEEEKGKFTHDFSCFQYVQVRPYTNHMSDACPASVQSVNEI